MSGGKSTLTRFVGFHDGVGNADKFIKTVGYALSLCGNLTTSSPDVSESLSKVSTTTNPHQHTHTHAHTHTYTHSSVAKWQWQGM